MLWWASLSKGPGISISAALAEIVAEGRQRRIRGRAAEGSSASPTIAQQARWQCESSALPSFLTQMRGASWQRRTACCRAI